MAQPVGSHQKRPGTPRAVRRGRSTPPPSQQQVTSYLSRCEEHAEGNMGGVCVDAFLFGVWCNCRLWEHCGH